MIIVSELAPLGVGLILFIQQHCYNISFLFLMIIPGSVDLSDLKSFTTEFKEARSRRKSECFKGIHRAQVDIFIFLKKKIEEGVTGAAQKFP